MPAPQASPDPAQSAKLLAEVAERSSRLMGEFLQRQAEGKGVAYSDEFGIARAFMDLYARMLADPWKVAEMQTKMFWDHVALWQSAALRVLGKDSRPVAEPGPGDNRFRDDDWQNLFLFDYLKQSYLIAARHVHGTVSSVKGRTSSGSRCSSFRPGSTSITSSIYARRIRSCAGPRARDTRCS